MFNYRDIVSREVIERAKNDPAYKDELAEIGVDKILKKRELPFPPRRPPTSRTRPISIR